jgi:hypothetical protein
MRSLLHPDGLPAGAAAQLEAAFGSVGRAAVTGGRGRLGRVRTQVRAAPPRLLDWMSGQVLDHPAVLYDREGVELLAARQGRSIAAAMGGLQLASVVHGFCDWYNTGSYVVRRLNESGTGVDRAEVRRLTNAALMSRGRTVDERALARSTELRLVRGWVGRGLVDALPFGSTLGRASVRAADRIDGSDLPGLVTLVRSQSG